MPETDIGLYPAIEPFDSGLLPVGQGHKIYYEQSGAPDGLPVIGFHGGPASGIAARHRQFFDPAKYRIVLFDQRGSGKSQPHGLREHNCTDRLLADTGALRDHLKLDRTLLFGGSWGASLALAAAAAEPARTIGLVLRGVFLTGQADMQWFFQDAGQLIPDAWASFAGHVGQYQADEILRAYTEVLEDPKTAASACAAWIAWESSLTRPGGSPQTSDASSKIGEATIRKYRLQAAYLNRLCDLGEPAILAAAKALDGIPTAIVHGRLDWVCRAGNAWKVHKLIGASRLRLIDRGGHDPFSADMVSALTAATNCFARDQQFNALGAEWKVA